LGSNAVLAKDGRIGYITCPFANHEEAMYAVIESGGKQYRVAENDRLTVEKIDAKAGDSIQISKVLMLADGDKITVGKPTVPGAIVTAKVLSQQLGKKLRVAKFIRRGGYFNRMGHRQALTTLAIEKITA
jgi:large subunit ribosomal protein L21